jgi:hypothetical protein
MIIIVDILGCDPPLSKPGIPTKLGQIGEAVEDHH